MSVEPRDTLSDAPLGSAQVLARAALADLRSDRRLNVAIDDVFLPEDDRLDDRVRASIAALIAAAVGSVERDLRALAARFVTIPTVDTLARLTDAGLLRDRALMAELVGRARQDLLAAALDMTVPRDERSGLLARLADCPDGPVAAAAAAMLVAESRRVSALTVDLPAALHERVVWWVAAALHASVGPEADTALAEAAALCLAAHDPDVRLDAAAMRLADAIDAQSDELGELLVGSLADANPALFAAALARAASLDFADARVIALDPDGDRLWLVLRALGVDRAGVARIGLMLAEADPRRDLEAFADSIDSIAAIERDRAAAAIAPMRLHPDFRAALRALERTPRC